MAEQEYFKKALSDFTFEFAGGNAIRKLAKQNYSIEEIAERLDYPMPKSKIADIVWKEYISSGRIQLEKPPQDGKIKKCHILRSRALTAR